MQSALRVALLATVVDFGGIERVLLTLLRHMRADIELFPVLFARARDKRNPFLESLDAYKVAYDVIYIDTSRFKYLNPLRNIGDAIARSKEGRFDLIHSHGYRADLIGLAVSKRFGLPIISTCHGFISTDWRLSFYNKLDVFLLRYFNQVIAVSEQMKRDLIAQDVDGEKIQVVTNAVFEESGADTKRVRNQTRARLEIPQEEFIFGFVGRLSEEKGLNYLLEAVRRWTPKDYPWRLVLVGDGPQRSALEQTVRNFGLGGKVFFAGFQSDTAEWYPAMDAFVLPSLTEGTPMVLLEAMANGIPVIATSVGGVPAIISSGENGLLVPSEDSSRLLDAMQLLASDRDLRERLCTNAIRLIRRDYNVTRWIEQMAGAYVGTLQQTRRG